MNLSTRYLGFDLPHPLIVGASPLATDLDTVRRLEDAGAAAIVMPSLFEEQITREELGTLDAMERFAESSAEATSIFPRSEEFRLGPAQYLEQVARIKQAVRVPVIGSLNGVSPAGWLRYARQIQEAGADALELNVYHVATDPAETGGAVEQRVVDLLKTVRAAVRIPVAVKLSPYYSALAHLVSELDGAGADGLVLFNRFYQPDIDLDALEVTPILQLSDSSELLLRLRWLAILSGRVQASLALSGGVHSVRDAIKGIMAGAHAVQVVSTVLQRGPGVITDLRQGMATWLEQHQYASLAQAQGSLGLQRSPDPQAYERANYMRVLHSWR